MPNHNHTASQERLLSWFLQDRGVNVDEVILKAIGAMTDPYRDEDMIIDACYRLSSLGDTIKSYLNGEKGKEMNSV